MFKVERLLYEIRALTVVDHSTAGDVAVKIEFDRDVNALYLRLHSGVVSRTMEQTEGVYVDLDATGLVLGVEFPSVQDFTRVVGAHDGLLEIPERFDDAIPA